MIVRTFLCLLVPAIVPQLLLAQPYALWIEYYNGPEIGSTVIEDSDGGYVVAGSATQSGFLDDILLMKVDSYGDSIWAEIFGGSSDEDAHSMTKTSDGGYILTGATASFSARGMELYLLKTDSHGNLMWFKTYGGEREDAGYGVAETYDEGYIATGIHEDEETKDDYLWLIRTDAQGDTFWTRTYGIYGSGRAVVQTSDSAFVIAGLSGKNLCLLKADRNGDLLWNKYYGGPEEEEALSVLEAYDGNLIVAGFTSSYGAGDKDVWLLKTDANGDTLWTKTYGGVNEDVGSSVIETADSGYLICGWDGGAWNRGREVEIAKVFLIKTDVNGDTLWTRRYGRWEKRCYGYSIDETSDGGYIISGKRGRFFSDLLLLKVGNEPPDVTITLTPDATEVKRGGFLGYTVEVTNNTDHDRSFEYWSDAYLWTGEPYKKNPVFGPKDAKVKAGVTQSGHLYRKVGYTVPLKTYTLCGRIGFHCEGPWTEDCFEFTVVP